MQTLSACIRNNCGRIIVENVWVGQICSTLFSRPPLNLYIQSVLGELKHPQILNCTSSKSIRFIISGHGDVCGWLNTVPDCLHPYCWFLRNMCLLMEAWWKPTALQLKAERHQPRQFQWVKAEENTEGFRSVFYPFNIYSPNDISAAGDQIRLEVVTSLQGSRWLTQLGACWPTLSQCYSV